VAASVEALKDGKIDAFFWSGGLPTAAVLDLASTPRLQMVLLPSADALSAMQQRYGPALYLPISIEPSAYPGLKSAVPVVGVANVLVVNASMSEELAYNITRLLFEKQRELVAIHPEANHLSLSTATSGSPAPFHRGAIRYYREQRAWRD
jgi:TRAP transporter TAXI family solute receptor